MSTYVTVAVLFLVSCLAGLHTLRSVSKDPTYSRGEKVAAFLAAFVGWPFVLVALLAIIITFWDLMFLDDADINSLRESPPPDPR